MGLFEKGRKVKVWGRKGSLLERTGNKANQGGENHFVDFGTQTSHTTLNRAKHVDKCSLIFLLVLVFQGFGLVPLVPTPASFVEQHFTDGKRYKKTNKQKQGHFTHFRAFLRWQSREVMAALKIV